MSGSGAPRRDTPPNEDFEGKPDQSDQQGEQAPREITEPGRRRENSDDENESDRKNEG